ncbi:hypothetical protein [Parasitella parasitica]|uniref:Uncharacterized protein n=1 Tax=Parasitella parasitica TaxID=35722 RepID=A0A0B7N4R4_9FUNG|nr:hypothetical protein [Parasitella parasitica]
MDKLDQVEKRVDEEASKQEDEQLAESSLTQEEQEGQKTIQAYDELLEIKEKLVQDNTQYELHVKYIELLKQLDFQEQLEEARYAMHDIYPLTEKLWLDWINDAKKDTSVEGQTKLLSLYNHSEQDYLSINIWKDYVDYILEKFHEDFSQDNVVQDESVSEFIEQTRQDLLKAVRATSAHVKQSQQIWMPYSEFELEILQRFKDTDQLDRVRKMYLDRLAVLHLDCEETFNAYSSFVSAYDNSNYEETMVKANKIYAKTKKAAEERDYYEMQLESLGYTLDAFNQYIDYEKRTKAMFSLVHVRSIYERAIVYYCTDPSLWNDYILFLIERARVQVFLETTCLRAIRNCPWSGILWAHLARLMEFAQKEDEQIDDIFDRALSSRPLLTSTEDLVAVLLAKCDYKRRKVDWEDVDPDAVMDLRVAFEESLQYIAEGDPYYRVEKYYAYISHKRLGDAEKAREIWQNVVDQHGLNTEAWIEYILFEQDQGNTEKCESLFKQAIQKNIDNPARLISVWSSVEHEIGTLESYETSLVRINRKSKTLAKQWQPQAQQYKPNEQQNVVNTKEKKEMDRKKKSAHRLAQKQRAKEKKKEQAIKQGEAPLPEPSTVPTNDDESNKALEKEAPEKEKTRKRKFSADEKVDNDNAKKHKANEERPIAPFTAKPRSVRPNTRRGKSVKLPQRTLSRNDVQTVKEDTTNNEDDAPEKSNDDFRAMLLSSKKIPPPVLMILMGNIPQASSSIEDVTDESTEESQITKATKEDDWNKVSKDEVDEEPVPSAADIITRSPSPNIPISDNFIISASAGGKSLVLAYKTKFVMVQLNNEGEYSALGQGSGCQGNEEITAVLCLPLFVPSTRLTQNYVMCGYNTGWIRVFSDTGVLLTEQQLETSPVLTMKIRTPPPTFRVSSQQFVTEDEDISILFAGNRVVSIDGQSLWMVLRVCDGQRESGIDASRMHTAFTYKKWEFQHQDQVLDFASLGPSPSHSQTPYMDPSITISTSTVFPSRSATSRYIGVGAHPMFAYYATSESSRPLMSAASMASYVVSRVTSPVFSFAKSWWGSNNNSNENRSSSTSGGGPTPYVPEMRRPPSHIEPATPISAILSSNDTYRKINAISICPPSTSAQRQTLAATSDALGRVILWDVIEGEMIRMWKGVRDAVCGWVEAFERDLFGGEDSTKILQFLVMYSSKRGFLKVFQMRHGKQVGAYHVGSGWQLVPCAREPLGSSMVNPSRRKSSVDKSEYSGLSNCLLVGPDGEVRKVNIILKDAHQKQFSTTASVAPATATATATKEQELLGKCEKEERKEQKTSSGNEDF